MTTRRGVFLAPFDDLADPRVVGDLAALAEAAGWDGFFVWDHLQYGERVSAIADAWTCCAAVAMRTSRMTFGPMVTPLARRRPQVVAQQAASLAVLSAGRFVLGLGLGDDWVGEFSDHGDEADPKARARLLDEGLARLRPLLDSRVGPRVPIWMAGRFGNRAPLRRAVGYDGFFVIDLREPSDLDAVAADVAAHSPPDAFELVMDLRVEQDPAPWMDRGAAWVLTRIGPYDLDVEEVRRIIAAGP